MSGVLPVDNIFILYPAGSGGNHLQNLIGTCEGTESLLNSEELMSAYASRNKILDVGAKVGGLIAHHNEYKLTKDLDMTDGKEIANEGRLINPKYKKKLLQNQQDGKINIVLGHWGSFQRAIQFDTLTDITNIRWIVMTGPSPGSLGAKRTEIEGWYEPPIGNSNYRALENIEFDQPRSSIPLRLRNNVNAIALDSDIFISPDGIPYVREILQKNFGLLLPETSEELHRLWLEMLQYRVDHG